MMLIIFILVYVGSFCSASYDYGRAPAMMPPEEMNNGAPITMMNSYGHQGELPSFNQVGPGNNRLNGNNFGGNGQNRGPNQFNSNSGNGGSGGNQLGNGGFQGNGGVPGDRNENNGPASPPRNNWGPEGSNSFTGNRENGPNGGDKEMSSHSRSETIGGENGGGYEGESFNNGVGIPSRVPSIVSTAPTTTTTQSAPTTAKTTPRQTTTTTRSSTTTTTTTTTTMTITTSRRIITTEAPKPHAYVNYKETYVSTCEPHQTHADNPECPPDDNEKGALPGAPEESSAESGDKSGSPDGDDGDRGKDGQFPDENGLLPGVYAVPTIPTAPPTAPRLVTSSSTQRATTTTSPTTPSRPPHPESPASPSPPVEQVGIPLSTPQPKAPEYAIAQPDSYKRETPLPVVTSSSDNSKEPKENEEEDGGTDGDLPDAPNPNVNKGNGLEPMGSHEDLVAPIDPIHFVETEDTIHETNLPTDVDSQRLVDVKTRPWDSGVDGGDITATETPKSTDVGRVFTEVSTTTEKAMVSSGNQLKYTPLAGSHEVKEDERHENEDDDDDDDDDDGDDSSDSTSHSTFGDITTSLPTKRDSTQAELSDRTDTHNRINATSTLDNDIRRENGESARISTNSAQVTAQPIIQTTLMDETIGRQEENDTMTENTRDSGGGGGGDTSPQSPHGDTLSEKREIGGITSERVSVEGGNGDGRMTSESKGGRELSIESPNQNAHQSSTSDAHQSSTSDGHQSSTSSHSNFIEYDVDQINEIPDRDIDGKSPEYIDPRVKPKPKIYLPINDNERPRHNLTLINTDGENGLHGSFGERRQFVKGRGVERQTTITLEDDQQKAQNTTPRDEDPHGGDWSSKDSENWNDGGDDIYKKKHFDSGNQFPLTIDSNSRDTGKSEGGVGKLATSSSQSISQTTQSTRSTTTTTTSTTTTPTEETFVTLHPSLTVHSGSHGLATNAPHDHRVHIHKANSSSESESANTKGLARNRASLSSTNTSEEKLSTSSDNGEGENSGSGGIGDPMASTSEEENVNGDVLLPGRISTSTLSIEIPRQNTESAPITTTESNKMKNFRKFSGEPSDSDEKLRKEKDLSDIRSGNGNSEMDSFDENSNDPFERNSEQKEFTKLERKTKESPFGKTKLESESRRPTEADDSGVGGKTKESPTSKTKEESGSRRPTDADNSGVGGKTKESPTGKMKEEPESRILTDADDSEVGGKTKESPTGKTKVESESRRTTEADGSGVGGKAKESLIGKTAEKSVTLSESHGREGEDPHRHDDLQSDTFLETGMRNKTIVFNENSSENEEILNSKEEDPFEENEMSATTPLAKVTSRSTVRSTKSSSATNSPIRRISTSTTTTTTTATVTKTRPGATSSRTSPSTSSHDRMTNRQIQTSSDVPKQKSVTKESVDPVDPEEPSSENSPQRMNSKESGADSDEPTEVMTSAEIGNRIENGDCFGTECTVRGIPPCSGNECGQLPLSSSTATTTSSSRKSPFSSESKKAQQITNTERDSECTGANCHRDQQLPIKNRTNSPHPVPSFVGNHSRPVVKLSMVDPVLATNNLNSPSSLRRNVSTTNVILECSGKNCNRLEMICVGTDCDVRNQQSEAHQKRCVGDKCNSQKPLQKEEDVERHRLDLNIENLEDNEIGNNIPTISSPSLTSSPTFTSPLSLPSMNKQNDITIEPGNLNLPILISRNTDPSILIPKVRSGRTRGGEATSVALHTSPPPPPQTPPPSPPSPQTSDGKEGRVDISLFPAPDHLNVHTDSIFNGELSGAANVEQRNPHPAVMIRDATKDTISPDTHKHFFEEDEEETSTPEEIPMRKKEIGMGSNKNPIFDEVDVVRFPSIHDERTEGTANVPLTRTQGSTKVNRPSDGADKDFFGSRKSSKKCCSCCGDEDMASSVGKQAHFDDHRRPSGAGQGENDLDREFQGKSGWKQTPEDDAGNSAYYKKIQEATSAPNIRPAYFNGLGGVVDNPGSLPTPALNTRLIPTSQSVETGYANYVPPIGTHGGPPFVPIPQGGFLRDPGQYPIQQTYQPGTVYAPIQGACPCAPPPPAPCCAPVQPCCPSPPPCCAPPPPPLCCPQPQICCQPLPQPCCPPPAPCCPQPVVPICERACPACPCRRRSLRVMRIKRQVSLNGNCQKCAANGQPRHKRHISFGCQACNAAGVPHLRSKRTPGDFLSLLGLNGNSAGSCGGCSKSDDRSARRKRSLCTSCSGRSKREIDAAEESHRRAKRTICLPCGRKKRSIPVPAQNCSPCTNMSQLFGRYKRSISGCRSCAGRSKRDIEEEHRRYKRHVESCPCMASQGTSQSALGRYKRAITVTPKRKRETCDASCCDFTNCPNRRRLKILKNKH